MSILSPGQNLLSQKSVRTEMGQKPPRTFCPTKNAMERIPAMCRADRNANGEKTKMTQRPLTAAELAKAKQAYQLMGELYAATNVACVLVEASNFLVQVVNHGTSDGKPLRTERVPTKEDIGRRVKVRENAGLPWSDRNYRFAGILFDGTFIVENECAGTEFWRYAIIDEDAA